MHPAELAALAAYDAASSAPDTEVTGPPGPRSEHPREGLPTLVHETAERVPSSTPPRRPAPLLVVLALIGGLGGGFAVSELMHDRAAASRHEAAIAEAPSPSAEAASPAPSASAAQSVLSKARAGEADALVALEQKSPYDRSAAENLALAQGRIASKLRALDLLQRQLASGPDPEKRLGRLRRLKEFFNDRDTTLAAATILAELPGPDGADVLYAAWVGTPDRNETTMLAEALVYSPDVRSKASPALAAALDLRQAESCEDYLAVVPRAARDGDSRSLHLLGQLTRTAGCGPRGGRDCFACLRPLDADPSTPGLNAALRDVAARPAPDL